MSDNRKTNAKPNAETRKEWSAPKLMKTSIEEITATKATGVHFDGTRTSN
jgi:hypothetical protein